MEVSNAKTGLRQKLEVCEEMDSSGGEWTELGVYPDLARARMMQRTYHRTMYQNMTFYGCGPEYRITPVEE